MDDTVHLSELVEVLTVLAERDYRREDYVQAVVKKFLREPVVAPSIVAELCRVRASVV